MSTRARLKLPAKEISNELKAVLFLSVLVVIPAIFNAFQGINWSDSAQIFHFGNRILHGDFPYRDFPYQTGFLPIWVDSVFQGWFGELYQSSLIAALTLRLATLIAIYFVFRQFESKFISIGFAFGFSLLNLDLIDGGNDYWSDCFLILTALSVIIGFKRIEKKASFAYFFLAGVFLSWVMTARQTNGVVCASLVSTVMLFQSFKNRKSLPASKVLAYFSGLGCGYILIAGFLLLHGALQPTWHELFIAAVEKKRFNPLFALVDALTGGSVFTSSVGKLVLRMMLCNIFPLVSILAIYLPGMISNHDKESPFRRRTVLMVIPALMIIGLLIPEVFRLMTGADNFKSVSTSDIFVYDFSRVFFTLVLLATCLFPGKIESFFGLSNLLFSVLTSIVLGSVWAMQMSWMGRGYVRKGMLLIMAFLMIAMSKWVPHIWKRRLILIFVAIAMTVVACQAVTHSLGQEGILAGYYKLPRYELDHPMTRSIMVNREKAATLFLLKRYIRPGDSCFIYGSAPILYDLLQCKNPTNLDVAYADAVTLESSRNVLALLNVKPPEWIIETGQLRPLDGTKEVHVPTAVNLSQQPGPKKLLEGLRAMMRNYQLVTTVREELSNQVPLEERGLDHVASYRLHRRLA